MIILSWNSPFSDCNTRISVSRRFLPWTIEIMSFCAVIRLEWLVLFLCCLYKWWLQDSLFKTEREVLTLLVIDAFRSILFVSVFRGSLLMIRPVSDNNRLVFFEDFSDLSYFCLLQEYSNVCLLPFKKVHSSSWFPSLFLNSLESFSVSFLRAKLGLRVASWFALTPPRLKWLTENPIRSLQTRNLCSIKIL